MDEPTRSKLQPILLRHKLGQFVSEEEQAFMRLCWRQWPKEYSALQTEEVHPHAAKRIASTQRGAHANPTRQRAPKRTPPRRPARRRPTRKTQD